MKSTSASFWEAIWIQHRRVVITCEERIQPDTRIKLGETVFMAGVLDSGADIIALQTSCDWQE